MSERQGQQAPVMTAEDALAVYRLLNESRVVTWINGGWGVDALVGRQTRPHADLDLFVGIGHVPALRSLLGREGFEEIPGGRAANFVLRDSKRREVDVHVFELDTDGNGLYPNADGTTWVCPAAGLCGQGTISGRQVRCFTADLQLQCYSGYELEDSDRHDIALLHDAFPLATPLPIEVRV